MKEFTFENQGTNTYLVYAINSEDSVDTMSLGMLTNNKIPGLAPAIFTQMDTNKYIKYNVSAHISVKQFFSGPVNKKRLIGVFNGIVDAMLSAEDYMIDVNTIIMDLDYIFADVSTCETFLICLPLADTESMGVDLGVFFKNIMFSTQFDQTENCDHVAKIMNYLNSTPVFSLADFKELLRSVDIQSQPAVQPVTKQQPVVQPASQVIKSEQPKVVSAQTTEKPVQMPPVQTSPVQTPPVQKPSVQKPVSKTPPVQTPPIQVPPVQTIPNNQPKADAPAEKKMTMMDLLMHYSKENVAIYKAQKEAAKNSTSVQVPAPAKPVKQKSTPPTPSTGFAIPGQPTPPPGAANQSFAIPGQPAPSISPNAQAKVEQQKAQVPPVVSPAVVQPAPQSVTPSQQTYQTPVVPQSQSMNFGETTVLGGGSMGETTVLGAATATVKENPHLIRAKNNEKINLNKPVFRIGKEKSYVDYFISDNTAISRSHANFITREGEYFVTDTNSTNHTYVNGVMIQSNVETKLAHGDKVRLANEDFEFKLY